MADLKRRIGQERAALCIKYFSNIITQSSLQAIGAAILDIDWQKEDWGDDNTEKLNSTYEQCLDLAFGVLGSFVSEKPPTNSVDVVCCRDGKNQCIEETFYRQKNCLPMFGTLTIATGREIQLLQCADLGAGSLREGWKSIAEGYPEADLLPWGDLPSGKSTSSKTAFWSLRQGAVIARAWNVAAKRQQQNQ